MPDQHIGNSNQILTISGVVSAPAYSWASDNNTGLYRIGADNIGVAANGAKVLDIATTGLTVTGAFASSNGISSTLTTDASSSTTGSIITAGGISCQKALNVGTTTTLAGAITYGGVTLSNSVTGTGNMVLSASPTLTGTLTLSSAGTNQITFGAGGTGTNKAVIIANGGSGSISSSNYGYLYGAQLNSVDQFYLTTSGFVESLSSVDVALQAMSGKALKFYAGGSASAHLTIASTGLVGIGMTPSNVLDITQNQNAGSQTSLLNNSAGANANAAYKLNNGTNAVYFALSGTGNSGTFPNAANMSSIQTTGGALALTTGSATPIQFGINYTEKMRLDTSGNLLINSTATGGPTTVSKLVVTNSNTNVAYLDDTDAGTSDSLIIRKASTAGTLARFYYTSTSVGTITTNGTTTTYGTSSDYRLKENVQPMTGGLDIIAALKPVTYDWIVDQTAGEGFIAHELQAVIPAAVVGEKDALNKDGNINPQNVDFGKIVPHLVAAIQELTPRLAALENK